MTKEELDLTETDLLLDALHRRFQTMIFMGMQDRGVQYTEKKDYFGNHVAAIGCTGIMRRYIQREYDKLESHGNCDETLPDA